MPKCVFVDANLFMHFRFWEMDWIALVGSEEVILEISSVTISELDKLKDQHPRKGLRKRAGAAIKRLRESIGADLTANISEGVNLHLSPHPPEIDYVALGLSPSSKDDSLIGCVIAQRDAGYDIAVATNDFGLELKAKQRDIAVLTPSEGDRLPDVLGEEEKKIRQLEADLQAEKLRRPLLDLVFEGSKKRHIELAVYPPNSIEPDEIHAEVQRIKTKHAFIEATSGILSRPHPGWTQPSQRQIDDYNEKLNEFYEAYEEYIPKRLEAENQRRASLDFEILLVNDGNTPAQDVDVFLDFPEVPFIHLDAPDPSEHPLPPPTPPKKPEAISVFESILRHGTFGPHLSIPSSFGSREPRNVSRDIEYEKGRARVCTHVRNLKHGLVVSITNNIHVPFSFPDEAFSFSIDFSILAANLPEAITGELNVVAVKEVGDPPK